MAHQGQKQTSAARVFDFVEQHLPVQEADDDNQSISNLEFILWMIALSGGIMVLQFLFHLLF